MRSDTDKQVASGSVSVSFFDNTSGWVLRSDCLPFAENYETLHSRKKVPAFIQAAKVRPLRRATICLGVAAR